MPKDRRWIAWRRLRPEEEAQHRKAAFTAIRKLYAEVVPLWASCRRGACRRHRCCGGDIRACLERSLHVSMDHRVEPGGVGVNERAAAARRARTARRYDRADGLRALFV
jgi:hypothetical protein